MAWLAYSRWSAASLHAPGADFGYTVSAARDIAAGHSPYLVAQYVYPPPLALLFAPFTNLNESVLWKTWLAVMVAAPVLGVAAFTRLIWDRCSWWARPVAFVVCSFTLLFSQYFPLSRDLELGQSDTLLFAAITVGAAAAPGARGVVAGIGGLIKVWPGAVVLAVCEPGTRQRWRTVLCAAAVGGVAPLSALAFGWSGIAGFLRNDFAARQQNLVSDSVWTGPQLLFSRTDLASPVIVSPVLRIGTTTALAALVFGLLVTTLRTRASRPLGLWNLLFCVILLLPVSHRQYAICVLPLVWWWVAEAVQTRTGRARRVAAILVVWWLSQTIDWPYNGDSKTISAAAYCIPLFLDLVACAASVAGAAVANRASGRVRQASAHRIGTESLDVELEAVDSEVGVEVPA